MGKVVVGGTVSLDGYIAGPNESQEACQSCGAANVRLVIAGSFPTCNSGT